MANNFVTVSPESTAPLALDVATQELDDGSQAGVSTIVDASGARAKTLAITASGEAKVLVTGGATAADQATANASLASILAAVDGLEGKDYATQTTLAAVLAKLTADPATQTTLAAILAKIIAAPATEAKQDSAITQLTSIAGEDFATQTTLAAILAKIIASPATEATLAGILAALASVAVTGTVTANAGTNLNTSALATSAKQDTLLTELQLKADLTETQPVSLASLPALAAGTAAIGKLAANSGVDIGDVDVTSLPKGSKTLADPAPDTTATSILAANASRKEAFLYNNGSVTVYLGKDNSVTTSTGFPFPAGAALVDSTSTDAWWGITASGTADIRVVEVA